MSDLFADEHNSASAPPLNAAPLRLAQVLLPMPIDKAYSYSVPSDITVQLGDYVAVPLGSRMLIGVVWGMDQNYDGKIEKLKAIAQKYELPPMGQPQRDFINAMAQYTLSALGSSLKLCLSAPSGMDEPKEVLLYKRAPDLEDAALKKISPKSIFSSSKITGIRLIVYSPEEICSMYSPLLENDSENLPDALVTIIVSSPSKNTDTLASTILLSLSFTTP